MIVKNNNIKRLEQGLTISIDKLPDCRHKARLMNIVSDASCKVVAVALLDKFNVNKWVAYIGYPDVTDLKAPCPDEENDLIRWDYIWLSENVRDIEQVKIMGEKLPKSAAEQLFPDWTNLIYKEEPNDA